MRGLNEKCAVIAVSNYTELTAARLAYLGLWSMQHRGQDSSGIAAYDKGRLRIHKKTGLVSQVYDEPSLGKLTGRVAVGHNRYTTAGDHSSLLNQPYEDKAIAFALAHNGNLPFTDKLKEYAKENHLFYGDLNDSGLMFLALSNELRRTGSIEQSVANCFPLFTGVFSCTALYGDTIFALRDSFGVRPLSIGKSDEGYVVASESVALDIIGAKIIRDVEPGELVIIKDNELRSIQIANSSLKVDAFEFIYLARPDSVIAGKSVYEARYRSGELLAGVSPVEADVVLGIPDSGTPAAVGYARAAGISYEPALMKNRYIGRTFIEPEKIRKQTVQIKFNAIKDAINGKEIVLVDDSLVRGNTLRYVIDLLRSHGARRVHVRIASPPVKHPDFYGIDTPNPADLIASNYSKEEIVRIIKADSLEYLPIDSLIESIGLPQENINLSSFDGVYPVSVPIVNY